MTLWRGAGVALIVLLAGGCATPPTTTASAPAGAASAPAAAASVPAAHPSDPWENWNRKVFGFNEALDAALLKPVAEGYRKVVPALVRTGVSNVLGNIYDVWSTANHFLQGKLQSGMEMGMRVLSNSFFGLGGLLDPATDMGLTRRPEDFGQTLATWGMASGPYLVLPLFGPSTVRDFAGLAVDRWASPSRLAEPSSGQWAIATVEVIDIRAGLLDAGTLLDQVALDKYIFLRDVYLSRRRDALHDGAPPMETFEDEADPTSDPKPEPAKSDQPKPAAAAAAPAASAASAPSR